MPLLACQPTAERDGVRPVMNPSLCPQPASSTIDRRQRMSRGRIPSAKNRTNGSSSLRKESHRRGRRAIAGQEAVRTGERTPESVRGGRAAGTQCDSQRLLSGNWLRMQVRHPGAARARAQNRLGSSDPAGAATACHSATPSKSSGRPPGTSAPIGCSPLCRPWCHCSNGIGNSSSTPAPGS